MIFKILNINFNKVNLNKYIINRYYLQALLIKQTFYKKIKTFLIRVKFLYIIDIFIYRDIGQKLLDKNDQSQSNNQI